MIAQLIRRGQLCILEYVGGDPYLFGCTHSHRAKSVCLSGLNTLNLDGPVFPVLHVVFTWQSRSARLYP